MKKVSILVPAFKTWRMTAICLWHFKQYGVPVESELILCNNSPSHPSIKAILETELCEGITIVPGDPEFTSHGQGYCLAAEAATGDWFLTAETDSFPTRCGWFDEYLKASAHHKLIGPEVPQSAGRYIHPAGALMSREIYDAAKAWQNEVNDWIFVPGAGLQYGYDKPYHVVVHASQLPQDETLDPQIELWDRVGPYQEMRSFDDDDWATYPQRTGINNFRPVPGKLTYKKLGYEAGQHLSYFAQAHGYSVMKAPTQLDWMPGREGKQAAQSTVFGGFIHLWAGTVANLKNDFDPEVRAFKLAQQDFYFQKLPERIRKKIIELEEAHRE